jgi:hypothetical protein
LIAEDVEDPRPIGFGVIDPYSRAIREHNKVEPEDRLNLDRVRDEPSPSEDITAMQSELRIGELDPPPTAQGLNRNSNRYHRTDSNEESLSRKSCVAGRNPPHQRRRRDR